MSGFGQTPISELNEEAKQIEKIKHNEKSVVVDAHTFETQRQKAIQAPEYVRKISEFGFRAGKDSVSGKRYFNVRGFNDPSHIYRGARMTREVNSEQEKKAKIEEFYFFGEDYDAVFRQSDKEKLAVNAWTIEDKKFVLTTIAKNEIVRPIRLHYTQVQKIVAKIEKQGDTVQL